MLKLRTDSQCQFHPSGVRREKLIPMRKQYNFWPGKHGLDAWDVDRLIELSADFPILDFPIEDIREIDTPYWSIGNNSKLTARDFADHFKLMIEVDLNYPVILNVDGRVMDGMHRIVKALAAGHKTIRAVRFEYQPEPDFIDCDPERLPY